MAQVLLSNFNRHAAGDRVAGMRVAHPVRAGPRKTLGALPIALPSQHAGAVRKVGLDLRSSTLQRSANAQPSMYVFSPSPIGSQAGRTGDVKLEVKYLL